MIKNGKRGRISERQRAMLLELNAGNQPKCAKHVEQAALQSLMNIGLVCFSEAEIYELTRAGRRQVDKFRAFSGEGAA